MYKKFEELYHKCQTPKVSSNTYTNSKYYQKSFTKPIVETNNKFIPINNWNNNNDSNNDQSIYKPKPITNQVNNVITNSTTNNSQYINDNVNKSKNSAFSIIKKTIPKQANKLPNSSFRSTKKTLYDNQTPRQYIINKLVKELQ